jgi:hypothetical protein
MKELPDFTINPKGQVSLAFLTRNITSMHQACTYVNHMPYGRNGNKNDLCTVFEDNCGTCSTKHALLKQLADENNFRELKLIIAMYKMSGLNTPAVSVTLKKHGLVYIPEAHNYLKYKERIFDFTRIPAFNVAADLLEETEIMPEQIGAHKIAYHKNYLENWLKENETGLELEELWSIREQCIRDLFTRNQS